MLVDIVPRNVVAAAADNGKVLGLIFFALVLGAAAILAVDAQARDLHELYRDKFPLTGYVGNPALWSFASFLRDRFHRYALLKANYIYNRDSSPRVITPDS